MEISRYGWEDELEMKRLNHTKCVKLPLTTNKYFEFQLDLFGSLASNFELSFRHRKNSHHGGLYFTFSVLKVLFIEINIVDNRHWDTENNCWEKHSDD